MTTADRSARARRPGPRARSRARSRATARERPARRPRSRRARRAREHGPHVAHVGLFALVEDGLAGDRDVERRRTDDQVGQDRVRGGPQVGSVVKPVHAAASARSCSKPTQAGVRNGRIATATMTIAVARPIRMAGDGELEAVRTRSSYPARPGNRLPRLGATCRLLVLEGPRLVPPALHGRSVGGSMSSSRGARGSVPGMRRDRGRGCRADPRSRPGSSAGALRTEAREVEHQRLVAPLSGRRSCRRPT